MSRCVIRCTLSGSYRKDYEGLTVAYDELITTGCQILSPHRIDFEETQAFFVRDKAESKLTEQEIEKHHLLAISQSDFIWIHMPNGYIGVSAAFELGYAFSQGIPVYSDSSPSESVFSAFIHTVPSVYKALEQLRQKTY